MTLYAYWDSPLGTVEIGYDEAIVSLRLTGVRTHPHTPSPLSELAARQLAEYFQGQRRVFDLPLRPAGTPFQSAVWEALLAIPYGETRSYGQLAAAIGNPAASRAVGQACNRNPIWILIPCHRVLGKSRRLTGYAGGLSLKQALLELEHRKTSIIPA